MTRREQLLVLLRWLVLGAAVGVLCGAASALFLYLLDLVTHFRTGHDGIVYALPLAGGVIGLLYQRYGQPIRGGNNLVLDTIHDEGPEIPMRMAPMVLLGTVLTHLFGGSAGREGTAVQMGASMADALAHRLRLEKSLRRQLLAAGVAGGFGSVFGTPIAGTVFGLEFVVLGSLEYEALVPAMVASVVGDMTTRAFGIGHTHYPEPELLELSALVLVKWLAFAVCVAATSSAFIELTHGLKKHFERLLPALHLRMAAGGTLVVLAWKLLGTGDYLGLGVPTIVRAFSDPSLPSYAFAAKLVLTAITLSVGFLGGEVTPLFFVGAALGNLLAGALDLPLALSAGVGLAAMFGAASNTPLALSIMAVELLGARMLPHVAIVSVIAYLLAGHRSIYSAQRLRREKAGRVLTQPSVLRELIERKPPSP